MQKMKKATYLVIIVVIMFVTGISFYQMLKSSEIFPTVLGEDIENKDEGDKEEENENKKTETEDKKAETEDKEDEKKDNTDETDNEENDKQETKEVKNKSLKAVREAEDVEDIEDVEDANEVDEDINETEDESGDIQEKIQELNKKIQRVESRINVLSANNVDVTAFLPMLSEVKDLVSQLTDKISATPSEAESFIENVKKELKQLEKLVKMKLGDEDEIDDDENGNDAKEEIQELSKNINEIEGKLEAISGTGRDVTALKTLLNDVKDLLSQANEKLNTGDFTSAESLAEVADKKLETLEHLMEVAFGDDEEEDGNEASEYKNEAAQFISNLKAIGEMDNGIGQQVSAVAKAQNDSTAKIENSINDINNRSAFLKFLIGPKYGSIAEVKNAIIENQTRIKVLTDVMNQITDPAIKLVLQDQIKQFQEENIRLQTFINESENEDSLFGWLVKLFS
jgi:ABC-type transporter Mla subunit MlaD